MVSRHNKNYITNEWRVLPKYYLPEDNSALNEIEALYKHLVFALKYEGINLLVYSKITQYYSSEHLTELVNIEPTGQYSRRIWFLIEWLLGRKLAGKSDLTRKQFSLPGIIFPVSASMLNHIDEYGMVDDEFEMPDKMIAMIVRFLEQNNGIISKRAREKELSALTEPEINLIEKRYSEIFIQ